MPRRIPHWLRDWLVRHQSPLSFWLHVVGIPLTILALGLLVVQLYLDQWDLWWRPVVLFVAGYLLQYIGHVYEGNDMGEVIWIKRLLNRPYVAISPRYSKQMRETSG